MHILDIVENSIEAGATRIEITINENISKNRLQFKIKDNGRGLSKKTLALVLDPFYTTKKVRRVGMGLALLAQSTHEADGDLKIKSQRGKGTEVIAEFIYNHIDRRPLGNLVDTLIALFAPVRTKEINFVYRHQKNRLSFVIDTSDIKKKLNGVAINEPEVLSYLKKEIKYGLKKIKAGQ